MNLLEKCNKKEIKLIENVGIKVENKNYTNDELRAFENKIIEYIMSASSKNGDIDKLKNEYDSIFRIIN